MDTKEQQIQDDDYVFPYHYVPQFTEGFTQTYSLDWGIYYASGLEFLLEKVKECSPDSVVDIGAGDGRFVKELSSLLPDKRIAGIDYSERAIGLAKALNPTLDFYAIDISKDDIAEKFDVATLIEVLEHIPLELVDRFISSLGKFLKPGGKLLLTVPRVNAPVSKKHFQHFSLASLRQHLMPYFSVEEIVFLDKQRRMVEAIKKIMQNDFFILNHWGARKRLYEYYKKNFLESTIWQTI